MVRLTSFPFQTRPTQRASRNAYSTLLAHLHPDAPDPGLTDEQQCEVFDIAGGFGWATVINATDATLCSMADRVETLLAAH